MSSPLHNTIIHTIQVSMNLMVKPIVFTVGNSVEYGNIRYTISRICHNENHLISSGKVYYEVYGKDSKGVEHLLKFFCDVPVYCSAYTSVEDKE